MIESYSEDPSDKLENGVDAGPEYDRLFAQLITTTRANQVPRIISRCTPWRFGSPAWRPEDRDKLDQLADIMIREQNPEPIKGLSREGKFGLFSFEKQKVLAKIAGIENF